VRSASLVGAAEHAPLLGRTVAVRVETLGRTGLDTSGLVKGNAQRLGAHAGSLGVLGLAGVLLGLASRQVLDLVLALLSQAVGDHTDVLLVKSRGEVVPVGDELAVGVEFVRGALEEVLLDGLQQGGDSSRQVGDGDCALAILSGNVTTGSGDEVASRLAGAKLEAQGHTTQLPLVELPAGRVGALVAVDTDAGGGENGNEAVHFRIELRLLLFGGLSGDTDGDNDGLELCHTGGQDKTPVVTVDHDHDTQGTSRQTPGVLPDVERGFSLAGLSARIFYGDVEHLAEILAQTVRSTTLDTTAGGGDVALDSCPNVLLALLNCDHDSLDIQRTCIGHPRNVLCPSSDP